MPQNAKVRDVAVLRAGMQPVHVRQANQRTVLSVVSLAPGISNAQLARLTGLAPQTVSSVLVGLEEQHLIERGEVVRGKRGQPATPLYMNPTGALSIGVEIGLRHIEVCLVGIGTSILRRYRRSYAFPDVATVFDELGRAAREMLDALPPAERRRVTGMGLAVPRLLQAPPLPGAIPAEHEQWRAVDIEALARAATGLDVSLTVDGHAACWAQRVAHPAPRPLSFLFMLLDTCMSGGIVAENQLWEGLTGGSGNLGDLLVLDDDGRLRLAGEMASLGTLGEQLADVGFDLGDLGHGVIDPVARGTFDAWKAGAATALAQVIITSTRVVEFELGVIESSLPPALTIEVAEATRQRIERYAVPGPGTPPVVHGHLGRSGAAYGAALLRMYRLYFSRDLQHIVVPEGGGMRRPEIVRHSEEAEDAQ